MSEESDVGFLVIQSNGYWAIDHKERAGSREELHSGDMVMLEVEGGALCLTSIEYDPGKKRFYSIHGFPLKVGRRAARGSSII